MTRLFLFAPQDIESELLLHCARAAVAAGDCAAIVLSAAPTNDLKSRVAALQSMGLATLLQDCDAELVLGTQADGLHFTDAAKLAEARKLLKEHSLGFFAGVSRHAAMEAAEAGADYVAFSQTRQVAGEPIIGWWQDVTQIPCIAFDPVEPDALADLLQQKPDFIRPSDAMWQSPEMASRVIAALSAPGGAA